MDEEVGTVAIVRTFNDSQEQIAWRFTDDYNHPLLSTRLFLNKNIVLRSQVDGKYPLNFQGGG